ncbi:Transducin/WD40 repeat-like superfamily protein [Abeliophyllum distichum]|uniref:Transducin/WD40 repeat-like superfamily protein n=1 Tax=Abeliophyllum distichum TaxID=126358 RepID=A0ABD1S919_9LAMI
MITGGKSFVSSPPAFSNDAKRLLVCTGNTVSIFSTSTGLQISELEGHGAPVTSVIVVPASTPASKVLCHCWTASLDGKIKFWDFTAPELMRTIDVRLPIHSMVIPNLLNQPTKSNGKSPNLFAYIYVEVVKQKEGQPNSSCGQIRKCNLTQSRLAGGVNLAETHKPGCITISPSGKYIGICEAHKLRIWEIPTKDSDNAVYKKIRLHHTKTFTTLAFHPTERVVAAGDVTGRILLWRGVGHRTFSTGDKFINGGLNKDAEERPGVRGDDDADSCTTWHWHSAEVNVLFFSSDGAYLFSGGREGVFVVWQLDTGKKKFLPRIGSPLLYFTNSSDPSLSSISCANNRIHLLRMPSMEILRSISGIKLPSSVSDIYEGSGSGVFFDHTAGLVAVPTDNYSVQFYSLFNDCEISEVQICERNHQPGDEATVKVNLVALSRDGSTMGTVETRVPEERIGGLASLKFWACGSQNKDFSLSTVIYEPHRDAGVSSIAFHPTCPMAVTSSYGGDFKIWVRTPDTRLKDQMLQSSGWRCHAVGSYKKKPMTAAAFSADGSVLAVAAENVITLWDPEQNILVAVVGDILEPITTLSFVGKSAYLVSASQGSNPQLTLWSMSKLSTSWSYKLNAEDVSCSLDGSTFAILALLPKTSESVEPAEGTLHGVDGAILLFNVENPVPLATWFVSKAQGGKLGFIQTSPKLEDEFADVKPDHGLLAYMNSDYEYVLFDPYGEKDHNQSITREQNLSSLEEKEKIGYASIYGELAEFSVEKDQTQIPYIPYEKNWETIFSGPSHKLAPLTKLCLDFLESSLERRSVTVE